MSTGNAYCYTVAIYTIICIDFGLVCHGVSWVGQAVRV